jgi:cytoskeletal protein CcmA (bactofilin family)
MLWGKKPQARTPVAPVPKSVPPPIPKGDEPMIGTKGKEPNFSTPQTGQAVLGRSLVLKGDLSGSEDLLIEGQIEGQVNLKDDCLTVGQDGRVTAEIHARQVVILGTVQGNVTATEKIEIRKSGHVVGDLIAAGIVLEEGAYFKGSIDILREEAPKESRPHPAPGSVET